MKTVISLLALVGMLQADNAYLSGYGGFNWLDTDCSPIQTRTGYIVGVELGWRLCNGFRFEVEGAYRNNRKNTNTHSRHTQTYSVLGNILYDFEGFGCYSIAPYIGAGAGGASELNYHEDPNDPASSDCHHRHFTFAWELIGGFWVPINDVVDLDLTYRFLRTTKCDTDNHSASFGLTYNF